MTYIYQPCELFSLIIMRMSTYHPIHRAISESANILRHYINMSDPAFQCFSEIFHNLPADANQWRDAVLDLAP
jgi:hypothetical protein